MFLARVDRWMGKASKPGACSRCVLVCLQDPTCYVEAKVLTKDAEQKRLDWALGKFKEGLVFKLPKVTLFTEGEQQFLHCPMKVVVDLGKCKTDGVLARTSGGGRPAVALHAQPPMTLAETKQLQTSQRFDVTAIRASVSESPRAVTETRNVLDAMLLDASGPPGERASEVRMQFGYDHPMSEKDSQIIELLREAGDQPVS